MLERLFLVRHFPMEIPTDAPRGEAASSLDSLNWGISPDSHTQAKAIGQFLREQNLSPDTICITAPSARFRESAAALTEEFGADLRWYTEEYLNTRPHGLTREREISHEALYGKDNLSDESIVDFMSRGPERLQRRIRERLSDSESAIVVTTGELIKGFLARIEGWPPLKIVKNFLSRDNENHLKEGEIFEISSRDPVSHESVGSFRYKRKISPGAAPPIGEWQYFEVPRYSAKELLDPNIWGNNAPL